MQSSFLSQVEAKRPQIINNLPEESKGQNGQFMTPAIIAETMANMFSEFGGEHIRLLDPGAGSGSLTSAFLDKFFQTTANEVPLTVVAYEIDSYLAGELKNISSKTKDIAQKQDRDITFEIESRDFVLDVPRLMLLDKAGQRRLQRFTHVIMNPPYSKLASDSKHRWALRDVGIEANNFYSAFVALSIELLQDGGELVAITPRSFCNGPYFRSFRKFLLQRCSFEQIHLFESRQSAFKEEKVLQENIIFKLVKNREREKVQISKSIGRNFDTVEQRMLPFERVVFPDDGEKIIHIPTNGYDDDVLERMRLFQHRLADFNIGVSTGPIVDFRVRDHIRDQWDSEDAPLIYPSHFEKNTISWPQNGKKPNAIKINKDTNKWLLPNGNYVLMRRFSSKEEPRRIIPSLFVALDIRNSLIGFENHLNVIHCDRKGLDITLAKGLTCYLSSTIVDIYFRQFSGHTQVNASDIRALPFPDKSMLLELAPFYSNHIRTALIDDFIERYLVRNFDLSSPNPVEKYNS